MIPVKKSLSRPSNDVLRWRAMNERSPTRPSLLPSYWSNATGPSETEAKYRETRSIEIMVSMADLPWGSFSQIKLWSTRASKLEAQLMLTNRCDAFRGQPSCTTCTKVTKHSTIPCVRYSFLLVCNSNFVFKTRRFSDIRLQECRDLEIRVRGHSRSLKVVPFDRLGMVSISDL